MKRPWGPLPKPDKPPKVFRDKRDWVRKSNCPGGPGTRPNNKYNFSSYLKKTGDFVESHSMSKGDCMKLIWAAHIWAVRRHCRVTTGLIYYPDGFGARVEIISHTRGR